VGELFAVFDVVVRYRRPDGVLPWSLRMHVPGLGVVVHIVRMISDGAVGFGSSRQARFFEKGQHFLEYK